MNISTLALFISQEKDLGCSLVQASTMSPSARSCYLADLPHPADCTSYIDAVISAQMRSLTKKYITKEDIDISVTAQEAAKLFFECNEKCRNFSVTDENSGLISRMLKVFSKSLPRDDRVLDLETLIAINGWATGPGASVLSKGRNSRFEKLFVNTHTATNTHLVQAWWASLREVPNLRWAEISRLSACKTPYEIVVGNIFNTVRKTRAIDRSIGTEPSLNMLAQKAIADCILLPALEKRYGYSHKRQPDRNREMARLGSIDGTFATIDLRSASDLIPWTLIQVLLYENWKVLNLLEVSRSPVTSVNKRFVPEGGLLGYSEGEASCDVELHMVSSMGNGFTFLLMTLLFYALIDATLGKEQQDGRCSGLSMEDVSVFGDDIVVPTELYWPVIVALESIGMEPNKAKSFHEGPFRESCGEDWWHGQNIRGVYAETLETDQDRYSLINRLNRWSARHKIPLRNLVQLLCLPEEIHPTGKGINSTDCFVPPDVGDCEGIHVPWHLAVRSRNRLRPRTRIKDAIEYNSWQPKEEKFFNLLIQRRWICDNNACPLREEDICVPVKRRGASGPVCPLGEITTFRWTVGYELQGCWAANLNEVGRLATLVEGSMLSDGTSRRLEDAEEPERARVWARQTHHTLWWNNCRKLYSLDLNFQTWEQYTEINLML